MEEEERVVEFRMEPDMGFRVHWTEINECWWLGWMKALKDVGR